MPTLPEILTKITAQMAEKLLSDTDVDMLELNISCPNVKEGGVQFGTSCTGVEEITKQVRGALQKAADGEAVSERQRILVTLPPLPKQGGADAISMINTFTGMRIDIRTRRPIIRNNTGGICPVRHCFRLLFA